MLLNKNELPEKVNKLLAMLNVHLSPTQGEFRLLRTAPHCYQLALVSPENRIKEITGAFFFQAEERDLETALAWMVHGFKLGFDMCTDQN